MIFTEAYIPSEASNTTKSKKAADLACLFYQHNHKVVFLYFGTGRLS